MQGDLAAALSAYTDCLGIRSSVYEKDPRAAAAEDLADVHQRISRIFCQQGELRAALGHCNKALELYSRLEEENGGAADLWNVSGCWQDMGGICWELGYRKEAVSFLQMLSEDTQLRDLLNTSRKYSQAIIEYFDKLHITRKDGDIHYLDQGF